MENAMNFKQQAECFMTEIATRKSDPVRSNTLHVYRSLLDARILPAIGGVELAEVGNKTVKALVGRLTEAALSPATINLAVSLVKQIMRSAVDENGDQLYPRTWNTRFIDAPRVDPTSQKAPISPAAAVSNAVQTTSGEVKGLIALLAGTGLRIGEALALRVGEDNGVDSFWHPETGTLTIRTTMVNGSVQTDTKTKAGTRVVDLDPALNDMLHSLFAIRESRMFNLSEDTFRRRLAALGIEGFHSLRRFRITHLQSLNVPTTLTKFWAGHAAGDITERYTKVGAEITARREWANKAGLGFQLGLEGK
jgi:integrase